MVRCQIEAVLAEVHAQLEEKGRHENGGPMLNALGLPMNPSPTGHSSGGTCETEAFDTKGKVREGDARPAGEDGVGRCCNGGQGGTRGEENKRNTGAWV